jgi:hypothetical protein
MKIWFIRKVHKKMQIDKRKRKKQFQNGIWSMMNYNAEWFWNYHSPNLNHSLNPKLIKIPILHKLVPMKHCRWNLSKLFRK